MQAHEEKLEWDEIYFALEAFRKALTRADQDALRALLRSYVNGYEPSGVSVEAPQSAPSRELPAMVAKTASAVEYLP